MKTVTIKEASKGLESMIDYSLSSYDEVNISTEKGSVVMLPEDEFYAMKETLNLLNDKATMKTLLESIDARENGVTLESYKVEDVFSDL